MPGVEGATPTLELFELRIPKQASTQQRSRPARSLSWNALALGLLLGILGFVVGSNIQSVPGGGFAFQLPGVPVVGATVDHGQGRLATVLAQGPVHVEVRPGRLSLDGITYRDILPTNRFEGSAGPEDLVVIDTSGTVTVVGTDEAVPVQVLLGARPDQPKL